MTTLCSRKRTKKNHRAAGSTTMSKEEEEEERPWNQRALECGIRAKTFCRYLAFISSDGKTAVVSYSLMPHVHDRTGPAKGEMCAIGDVKLSREHACEGVVVRHLFRARILCWGSKFPDDIDASCATRAVLFPVDTNAQPDSLTFEDLSRMQNVSWEICSDTGVHSDATCYIAQGILYARFRSDHIALCRGCSGKLRFLDTDAEIKATAPHIAFVNHQWTGFGKPDHIGIQNNVLHHPHLKTLGMAEQPRVAVETGTNSGVGLSLSVLLVEYGFQVFAGMRGVSSVKRALLDAAVAEASVDASLVEAIELDVSSDGSVT